MIPTDPDAAVNAKIEAYLDDDAEFVKEASRDALIITVGGVFEAETDLTITQDDVIRYYLTDARDITSGMRAIAGYAGDWRPIDRSASFSLNFFKAIDRGAFRDRCIKQGLQPQW